jgi:O-antigen ligase
MNRSNLWELFFVQSRINLAAKGNVSCMTCLRSNIGGAWRDGRIDALTTGAAICAAPLSIAIAESFLGMALAARIVYTIRYRTRLRLPQVFRWWSVWAVLEVASWLHSPQIRTGVGEIKHLLLIAGLFLVLPSLHRLDDRMAVWRGILAGASLGSAALVCGFVARVIRHHHQIAAGGDTAFYLRTGGLLHHWMIYSAVEVLVFGALLEFRSDYPEERWWTTPALAINCLAICLSLTRALWLACFVLLGVHLLLRRSRLAWALPLLPLLAFFAAPGPMRARMRDSLRPEYFSNAERVQMWAVGWRMIRDKPLAGVGAGRVAQLYTAYLPPGAPVPAYHGHLHDNAVQLAAEFGLPVLCAALLCLMALLRDLAKAYSHARRRDDRFLCRAALLGTAGFLITGLTDYTYGHSLGLIALSFVALAPLIGAGGDMYVGQAGRQMPHRRKDEGARLHGG